MRNELNELNELKVEKAGLKELRRVQRSSNVHWVGNGFPVRSVLNYNEHARELSPFLLLDYAVPHDFAPGNEKRGVGAHPHKGFETVTVAYQGELEHRDSSGGGGRIGAGDVQWMTAGNGIVHEEFHSNEFVRQGGTLEMVQLWVNLRAKDKSARPGYQTLLKGDIPTAPLPENSGTVRVIAGEYGGNKGPARTFTRINLWDVKLLSGHSVELPLPEGDTTALLVLSGEVLINDKSSAKEGDLAVFAREGGRIQVAGSSDATLLVLSGEPIDEPVAAYGPFVMNTQAEIQQAFADYQLGRMGKIE